MTCVIKSVDKKIESHQCIWFKRNIPHNPSRAVAGYSSRTPNYHTVTIHGNCRYFVTSNNRYRSFFRVWYRFDIIDEQIIINLSGSAVIIITTSPQSKSHIQIFISTIATNVGCHRPKVTFQLLVCVLHWYQLFLISRVVTHVITAIKAYSLYTRELGNSTRYALWKSLVVKKHCRGRKGIH